VAVEASASARAGPVCRPQFPQSRQLAILGAVREPCRGRETTVGMHIAGVRVPPQPLNPPLVQLPAMSEAVTPISDLPLPLERDVFLRTLIRELSGTLQDVVGLDEASGFVSVVGQRVGEQLNGSYREALAVPGLT